VSVLRKVRQERFAQAVAAGHSQEEAQVIAGYARNGRNAWRLRQTEAIAKRIEEILNESAKKIAVSREKIIEELAKVAFADIGAAPPTWRDKIGALIALGKEAGLFREQMEHSGTIEHVHSDAREQIASTILSLAAREDEEQDPRELN
jgi:predicted metal-dependent phosphoesterase TrpH